MVPPTLDGVRCTRVTCMESVDEDGCVLALENLSTINEAEQLAGRCLLARKADLDLNAQEDMVLVLGREVVSDDGRALGRVTEYLETRANDVLVIEKPQGGELLVPIIEETIVAVPEDDERPIVIHVLSGLE